MVVRATIQTLAVRGAMLGAGLVSSVITARTLGPAGRGIYYLVFMLGTLAVQFATLGLHASNTYLVAKDRGRFAGLLGTSLWVSVVVGSIVAGVVVLLSVLTDRNTQAGAALYWVIPYVPCALFVLLASSLFVGAGRVSMFNAIQLTAALLAMAGAVLAALAKGSVTTFLAALVAAMFAAALVALACGLRAGAARLRFDRTMFAAGAHYASRAYVVGLLGFGVTRANVFVLAHSASADQIGLYSVAMQILDVLSILPISIATVLLPSLIGRSNAWPSAARAAAWTAALMVPACVITAILAEPLITRVFGWRFEPAALVTALIMPAAFFIGIVSVLSQYLAAGGFPREMIAIWVAALVVVVTGSSVLVPRLGANGAAVSLSGTYLLVLVMMTLAARRLAARQQPASASPAPRAA
jgi:antigen flippase